MIQNRRRALLIGAGVLLFAELWVFFWLRISDAMKNARSDAVFAGFTYDGAYYTRMDADTLRLYTETPAGESLCGDSLGTVTLSAGISRELFACRDVPREQYAPAVVLQDGTRYLAYELTGFTALDNAPSVRQVLDAYGITGADAVASVTVTEADGTAIDTITDADALSAFYEKLSALGDDIGEQGEMQAYYDAYVQQYPDSQGVTLENGALQFADDDSKQRAMTLWSDGMCLVSISLKNGLRLRELVYAPVPGFFAVYGIYRLTSPFFS